MFGFIFKLLIVAALGYFVFDYFSGEKSKSWSYCGEDLKREKRSMENEVKKAMDALGERAEVTWTEDAECISAAVKDKRRVTSLLLDKVKDRF